MLDIGQTLTPVPYDETDLDQETCFIERQTVVLDNGWRIECGLWRAGEGESTLPAWYVFDENDIYRWYVLGD